MGPETPLELRRLLAAVDSAPPVDAADVFAAELAKAIRATEVAFLIADFSGRMLIRLAHAGNGSVTRVQGRETAQQVPLDGSVYGQTLRTQQVVVDEGDPEKIRLVAPVSNRGEAIGVLELVLPAPPDEQILDYVSSAAQALAFVVITNRRFTDLFAWGKRSVPLSLAAEIQHRLLPDSFTCEAGQFSLAGWVEPAGEVGGDTFDYSLERDTLHLSMTDAMGHEVNAALLATLLVGSLRNSRRGGVGLAEQARLANQALLTHTRSDQFVTGQLTRVDLLTGVARIVNAGHPPPLCVRAGRVDHVALHADPPFGLLPDIDYQVQELLLREGDRLVFVTDGVLDRNTADAHARTVLDSTADLHPRETVQRLTEAVLQITGGKLRDDASVLCLDWYGGPPRDRHLQSPFGIGGDEHAPAVGP